MNLETSLDSPTGQWIIQASELGVSYVGFYPKQRYPQGENTHLLAAQQQLSEYFSGARRQFDLSFDVSGTPFQQQVWRLLACIPFGETQSYGWIAQQLGKPKAVRAVGAANGKNPLSIVIPCHRVIGANGKLTGYAGGLAAKQWLLQHEGASWCE
ncbi:methylated-DNA--[protein]-cysteine S-methyltransferase [Pseudoalteromonas 'SMAR']|uniref:methylated-DNA--[protein]-cysteine S-methyltransferase n=1 Tax=Pseudoalteromonas 'SMAR' TaxID=3416908 RepID=UPI003AF277F9